MRLLHLGLGNFFRAHQAWYTDRVPDAEAWGYAAFAGRGRGARPCATAQEGLYTLVSRASDADRFEVVSSVSRAHAAGEHDAWLGYFRSPGLAVVTTTITEAGYLLNAGGALDLDRPEIRSDLEVLRRDPDGLVRTAAGRLVAGLAVRRRAEAGPVALVPCDNVPGNGPLTERMVRDLAELVDGELATWLSECVTVVTTVVDRITPRTTPVDAQAVEVATGFDDGCPVISEPFHEWVLAGVFPAGRPRWHEVGATFTDDVTPFEHRKLWLLNGAHSLLAYAGSIRGHATVAAAAADGPAGAGWRSGGRWRRPTWPNQMTAWPPTGRPCWHASATPGSTINWSASPPTGHRSYRSASCRCCGPSGRRTASPWAATRVLAAWICHLCGRGVAVHDARAGEVVPRAQGPLSQAAPRVLGWLEPSLGADADVTAAVIDQCEQFAVLGRR